MRYKHIIIDTPNLYHRAYYVAKKGGLDHTQEISPSSVHLALKMIQRIERLFLDYTGSMYFLFDNSKSRENRRKNIDPEYKSNRTKQDDIFYRSLDYFHLILLSYKDNFYMVKREEFEADDLVFPLIKHLDDAPTLLVSNDFDWFRSINDRVHVAKYEGADYRIYTPKEFEKKFEFAPSHQSLCLYKAFQGDVSDNIPIPIPHIPKLLVLGIVEKGWTLNELYRNLTTADFISTAWKEKIRANFPRLKLNYMLVECQALQPSSIEENIYRSQFSGPLLYRYYKNLGIKIDEFDPRVLQYYPREREEEIPPVDKIFSLQKTPRV